ncbi:MAG TPA: hypothetical protein VGA52_03410 [Anaerolineales bacterium]|jgi:hypothetical protein
MSSRDGFLPDAFDGYLRRQLQVALGGLRPSRELRRHLLWRAATGSEEEVVRIPEHILARFRPGGYRDLHHRLAGRSFLYSTPFGTAVFALIS